MATTSAIGPDLRYLKDLIRAGVAGVVSTHRERQGSVFSPPLHTVALAPMAAAAALAVLAARLTGHRAVSSTFVLAGTVGSVIGLGAAMAWASRDFTRSATQHSSRLVAAARDAHWLEAHPINYA